MTDIRAFLSTRKSNTKCCYFYSVTIIAHARAKGGCAEYRINWNRVIYLTTRALSPQYSGMYSICVVSLFISLSIQCISPSKSTLS